MNKRVWFINQYANTPALGGHSNRPYYLGKELIKKGFCFTLITSSYSHVPKRNYPIKTSFQHFKEAGISVVVVKNIVYDSAKSFKRILSMIIFWLRLYNLPLKKMQEPDYIIVSSISLLPILNAFRYRKKFANRPKIILEIRDIWPLSLTELGGVSPRNPFVLFLSWVERRAYAYSDYIVSVLPLANQHIESIIKTPFRFKHISNGIAIDRTKNTAAISQNLLSKISKDKFTVGYAGSIGIANAMENLIEAARILKDEEIQFIIVGDGHRRKDIVNLAKDLPNVVFHEVIPKPEVQSLLSHFDILFLGSRDSPLYRFGVSANKIFDYMLSAKPIIMAGKIPASEIKKSGCGTLVKADDPLALALEIKQFKKISKNNRKTIGKKGKDFVMKHRSYETLAEDYVNVMKELASHV